MAHSSRRLPEPPTAEMFSQRRRGRLDDQRSETRTKCVEEACRTRPSAEDQRERELMPPPSQTSQGPPAASSGGNCRPNARHAIHPPRRGATPEAAAGADGKRSVRSHSRWERTVRVPAGRSPPGGTKRPPPRTPSRGQVRSQGGLVTSYRRRKGIGPGRSA